jgi:PIN domain nuclease of toxin-antitoxin system
LKFLLDTHTLLWHLGNASKLSNIAENIIENFQNEIFVSIASVWEVAIKINLRKLSFNGGTKELVNLINQNNFILQDISPQHIFEMEKLPLHHRDPFDRIIIATAISQNLCILSKDENFGKYSVKTLW